MHVACHLLRFFTLQPNASNEWMSPTKISTEQQPIIYHRRARECKRKQMNCTVDLLWLVNGFPIGNLKPCCCIKIDRWHYMSRR